MRLRVMGGNWARGKDWLRAWVASPVSYRHNFLTSFFFFFFSFFFRISVIIVIQVTYFYTDS